MAAPAVRAADSNSSGEEELSTVTVTGSRIARRDFDAPSPVVTVSTETFDNSSTTGMESVLNQLPQFAPTGTQFASSIQSGSTQSPGAATLNLRGLGTNRNLVLIDGRRPQPSNAALVVDINTIPAAAIQGVEVITGGASAVYGPDAMAGVVNFILKKNFQGLTVDAQTGVTQEGDGREHHVSALMGMNSANGRGNIMVGLDWNKRDPVYTKDRSFYVNGWMDPNNPSGGFLSPPSYAGGQSLGGLNSPSQATIDSLFPMAPAGSIGPTSEFRFNPDGSLFVTQKGYGYNGPLNDLNAGRYTMMKKLANGDLDQMFTDGYVSTPLTRYSIFGRGNYDFNDDISAFTQFNYNHVKVTQRGGYPPAITIWQAPIPRDSRTLPAALNTLLDSRANPTADWSLYQVLDYNGPVQPVSTSNVWQIIAGLNGKLGVKDWTWEAYGSHGETANDFDEQQLPSLQLYQKLVAAPNFGVNGSVVGTPFGYTLTCDTGLPVFTQFTPSDACLTAIQSNLHNFTKLTQNVFEANLQGGTFDLPAGQVRAAIGVDYRKETFSYKAGNPASDILDNPIGLFASASTGGSTNVKEIYGEALVPVIKKLDLELGYRFSDFDTAGGTNTYKALFTWKALDQVTFRGGYQFATRAPNIAELYTSPTLNVVGFTGGDPCNVTTRLPYGNLPPSNGTTYSPVVGGNPNYLQVQALCRAIIGNNTSGFDTQTYNTPNGPDGFTRQSPKYFPLEIEVQQGNPNVNPEKGKTWTLGAVITDPFGWQGLRATLDFYQIQLSDSISPISSRTVYDLCFNANGVSNPNLEVSNPYCQLITRNPVTGDRQQVIAQYSNLGTIKTRGVDVSVAYTMELGPGRATASTQVNYLNKFDYQTNPTAPLVHAKGTLDQGGQFNWRAMTRFGYDWDNWSVGLSWRALSSIKDASFSLDPGTPILGVKAYHLFGLNGSYKMGRYELRAGVDNLFNKQPPVVGANPGVDSNTDQTNAGFYDTLGRRYYFGVKASF